MAVAQMLQKMSTVLFIGSLNACGSFHLLYIELFHSYLIGRKRTVNFLIISANDVITADLTIIKPRTLKVTRYHVKFARFVLLPVSDKANTLVPFLSSNVK